MKLLDNLSRKQVVMIAVGVLVVILMVTGFVYFLSIEEQKKQETEFNEKVLQEKREELKNLLEQSGNFEPTEDPVEQKDQLDILREQNNLEDELGEGDSYTGETNNPNVQQGELNKLRQQNK